MAFIQASAPAEKLPKLAHMKQGGEELEPYPFSSWGLDMFLSTAGKCFSVIQIQVSLSKCHKFTEVEGPSGHMQQRCALKGSVFEASHTAASPQQGHASIQLFQHGATTRGTGGPLLQRGPLHSTTRQNGGICSLSCHQRLTEAARPRR